MIQLNRVKKSLQDIINKLFFLSQVQRLSCRVVVRSILNRNKLIKILLSVSIDFDFSQLDQVIRKTIVYKVN